MVEPAGIGLGLHHVLEVLAGELVLEEGVALLGALGGRPVHHPDLGGQLVEPSEPGAGLVDQRLLGEPAAGGDRVQRLPQPQHPVGGVAGEEVVAAASCPSAAGR
jgi:hypothetical protein